MMKVLGTTTAVLLAAAGLFPGTAAATPSAASAGCALAAGSVTAGGDHREQGIFSTVPPTVRPSMIEGRGVYPAGAVRVSSSMSLGDDGISIIFVSGWTVQGDALYLTNYSASNGTIDGGVTRIGGGWGGFVALDVAGYADTSVRRVNTYGLRNDGTLFRWSIDTNGVWRNKVSAPGFAAVKSMALISRTRTYDTFLANTRGGALYTIHIPTSSPMKPIVKLVRRSTWQGFESLLAQSCGQYGTVVLGIDKDTKTGHLYAVGHATGATTVIQSLGKVPASFTDNVNFHWDGSDAPLFGE